MQHLKKLAICIGVLVMMFTAASAPCETAQGGFDLSWHTIDGGGATFSTGGGFQLGGTIGQPDASIPPTGGGFHLSGGFWAATTPIAVPCFGDIAPVPTDGLINVNDLLAVINAWGACPITGNCPADIAPPEGDELVNVNDLLALINAWGPCP